MSIFNNNFSFFFFFTVYFKILLLLSQDLTLQQGASRLQPPSANLDVFNKHYISFEDTFSFT
jgi:hypothetical protein